MLLYEDLTYKIRRAVFDVYNTLGYGHKENVYQKALAKELKDLKINYEQEKSLPVKYKQEKVGNYRPDFIVDNKVIIEIKAANFTPKDAVKQLTYYLKGTGYKLGLLVNFGMPRLYIKRVIWTPNPCKSALNPCESST